jgi:hypothetical protein
MRMRDVISELRAFAADLTDMSHDKTPKPELFVLTRPVKILPDAKNWPGERGRIDRRKTTLAPNL